VNGNDGRFADQHSVEKRIGRAGPPLALAGGVFACSAKMFSSTSDVRRVREVRIIQPSSVPTSLLDSSWRSHRRAPLRRNHDPSDYHKFSRP